MDLDKLIQLLQHADEAKYLLRELYAEVASKDIPWDLQKRINKFLKFDDSE